MFGVHCLTVANQSVALIFFYDNKQVNCWRWIRAQRRSGKLTICVSINRREECPSTEWLWITHLPRVKLSRLQILISQQCFENDIQRDSIPATKRGVTSGPDIVIVGSIRAADLADAKLSCDKGQI